MFLRVRGKGACPENSQATLMHIRGFRHTHTRPPVGDYHVVSTTVAEDGQPCPAQTRRPFRFPHFPMGIQAPAIMEAQSHYFEKLASALTGAASASEGGGPTESESSPEPSSADEVQRIVWKETWNVYDIIYDEVELFPKAFDATNAMLAQLASPEAGSAQAPAGAVLPSAQPNQSQTVVCSHYYAKEVLPADTWMATASESCGSRAAGKGPVVILDLSRVPPSEAGNKLAVELAWCASFSTLQESNPLIRASAVFVRLPYTTMPSVSQLMATASPAAALTLEAYDFIGEHLAFLHRGFTCHVKDAAFQSFPRPAPAVFLGKGEQALSAAVHQWKQARAYDGEVIWMICDHHMGEEAERRAEAASLASQCGVTVHLAVVPVQALIDGGEEPWDPYTQKERERLNYCPCCGDCGGNGGGGGDGHGHGHHHH